MHRSVLVFAIVVTLLASSCGEDADVETVADPAGEEPAVDDPPSNDQDGDASPILGIGPYPVADMVITTWADGPDGEAITHRLACLGDTATLTGDAAPGPAEAMCLALNEDTIRTRLIDGAATDQMCTEQYGGPETATITGTLDEAMIDTDLHRRNGCGISDWRLLDALLPAPT